MSGSHEQSLRTCVLLQSRVRSIDNTHLSCAVEVVLGYRRFLSVASISEVSR